VPKVALTIEELRIINNALNEVCHGIELPEFATRMGAGLPEVQALLARIHEMLPPVTLDEKP
jgi:hypothetical protein